MFLPHRKERDTRKLWEVMDIFVIWIVVMVIRVYAYVQTRQVVYIK